MKQLVHRLGGAYLRRILLSEWRQQTYLRTNERPIEYRFVFDQLTKYQPRTILDVGTGESALPHLMRTCGFLVTATDNVRDYWPEGVLNRHYHIVDDDITHSRLTDRFDAVTCVSTLEHIVEHGLAMAGMMRLLSSGGVLILTCPYNERRYSRNVYDLEGSLYGRGSPYVCQSFSRAELDGWLAANGGKLIEQEFWQCFTGEIWTLGQLVRPPHQVSKEQTHQLSCMTIRKD